MIPGADSKTKFIILKKLHAMAHFHAMYDVTEIHTPRHE
jgi:hypothetical protein